jgi:hypothetical protein
MRKMRKIILAILVIILALSWRNYPQEPTQKISEEKQKPIIIKSPKLKTEPTSKISLELPKNSMTTNYQCEEKTICSQMNSCKEAKFYLQSCGLKRLDKDEDGIPCEGRWCFSNPN